MCWHRRGMSQTPMPPSSVSQTSCGLGAVEDPMRRGHGEGSRRCRCGAASAAWWRIQGGGTVEERMHGGGAQRRRVGLALELRQERRHTSRVPPCSRLEELSRQIC
ncbi:hypothetical protein E2562_006716 [Oryza meyeriana var. granulata]|uniref:Uncharacterized protein n=1 Tax=Oryza meyeriana var. granulata TaxID=110450 RepID=A0A6G1EG63_9ORYZ|nr:hypothetical protein E2562_006716 [Oryza meyeriana var. granulata]